MRKPVEINWPDVAGLRVHPASIRTLAEPHWARCMLGSFGGCCNLRAGVTLGPPRTTAQSPGRGVWEFISVFLWLTQSFPGNGGVGWGLALGSLLSPGLAEGLVNLAVNPEGM